MAYKLEKYTHDERLTLIDFIYLFFVKLNDKFSTVDPENDDYLICHSGRSRSLGDIYKICKYYYPTTTIEEVKELLLDFGTNLVGHFCNDIDRRVYSIKAKWRNWGSYGDHREDEFGEPIEYRVVDKSTHKINRKLVKEIIKKYV